MLCARCQTRQAVFNPEFRARFEKAFDTPWPFPEDTCGSCFAQLIEQDPEFRARFEQQRALIRAKARAMIVADVQRVLNKGMDFADRIAEHVRRL